MDQTITPTPNTNLRLVNQIKAAVEGMLYLSPTLIVLAIFVFIPVFSSFSLSLNRVSPFDSNVMRYVGFGNYQKLLTDPEYWESLKNTLLFTLGTVPTSLVLCVVLGVALAYPLKRFSTAHRMMIFVPVIISTAVAGVLFRWMYHSTVGYINYFIFDFMLTDVLGIPVEGPNWLASKDWALFAVILATVWRDLGFNVIIAMAGVQNIDSSYYDAAQVDGANAWHRFWHITLPLLTPTLFFLLIINVINSFQAFGQIHVLTQGGPGQATTTLVYSIFYDAFLGTPQRGYASAQAYLLAIMVIAMSLIQFRYLSGKVHYQ